VIRAPRHKQEWCDGFAVRMRLLGWPEHLCDVARTYVHHVRRTYTGRAWQSYVIDCELWFDRGHRPDVGTLRLLPRRSGVGANLDQLLLDRQRVKDPNP